MFLPDGTVRTYDMLVAALKQKDVITKTIIEHRDRAQLNLILDEEDWVFEEKLISP